MIKRSFNAEPNAKLSDFFYYNMLQTYWIPIGILLCDGQRAVALTTLIKIASCHERCGSWWLCYVSPPNITAETEARKVWWCLSSPEQQCMPTSRNNCGNSDGNVFIKYLGVRFPGTASAPRILLLPCIFNCICRDIARLFPTLISQYNLYVYWRSWWRSINGAFIQPQHHIMTEFEDALQSFVFN